MAVSAIIGRSSAPGMFPAELSKELINRVKGASVLAQLSEQTPIPFNGKTEFTFNMDSEVDLVAEGGAKSRAGATFTPITITPLKVEYGARFTNEFLWAAEEEQLGILQQFSEGFARKVAKGIDLMAFHGVNPRTGSIASVISTNYFDSQVTQKVVTSVGTTADEQMEAAIALIQGSNEDATGAALSPAFRSALAALTTGTGSKMYPELAWGSAPGSINGLPVGVSSNVSAYPTEETVTVPGDPDPTTATKTTTDLAFVGNFRDYFRWGYSKEIPMKLIEFGDPDNSGRDLQGHNEIYLRAEMFVGWGILVPEAFARIVSEVIE